MVQFAQSKDAPAQIVVAKKRRKILRDGCDQPVVDRARDIVLEKRSLQRRQIVPRPGPENIRFDRIGKSCREGELMILKLRVELVKGALSQLVIAFHEKRTQGTLRERAFLAFVIDKHAEFHVDVREL